MGRLSAARRPGAGGPVVLVGALLALACAGDRTEGSPAAEENPVDGGPEAPVPVADGSPEFRTYRLLLVNPRPIQTLVYADAGAQQVLLDTIPRADSSRVNVEIGGTRLRLTATDRWGERLAVAWIDLRVDSLHRWEVPAAADPPAAPAGSDPATDSGGAGGR